MIFPVSHCSSYYLCCFLHMLMLKKTRLNTKNQVDKQTLFTVLTNIKIAPWQSCSFSIRHAVKNVLTCSLLQRWVSISSAVFIASYKMLQRNGQFHPCHALGLSIPLENIKKTCFLEVQKLTIDMNWKSIARGKSNAREVSKYGDPLMQNIQFCYMKKN